MSRQFLILAKCVNIREALLVNRLRNNFLYCFTEPFLALGKCGPGVKNVSQARHIVTSITFFYYLLHWTIQFQSKLLSLFNCIIRLYSEVFQSILMIFSIKSCKLNCVVDFILCLNYSTFNFLDFSLRDPVLKCCFNLVENGFLHMLDLSFKNNF